LVLATGLSETATMASLFARVEGRSQGRDPQAVPTFAGGSAPGAQIRASKPSPLFEWKPPEWWQWLFPA